MRPTKNKVFCVACKRSKMLFETQAKADNFILYNKDEIEEENGKAPVRSYYCSLCGGYHVTSNPSERSAESFDRKDTHLAEEIDVLIKAQNEIVPILQNVTEIIKLVEVNILQDQLDEAEQLLEECREKLAPFENVQCQKKQKWFQKRRQVDVLFDKINLIRKLKDGDLEDAEAFVIDETNTSSDTGIDQTLIIKKNLLRVKVLLSEVDVDIQNKNPEAEGKLNECRRMLKELCFPNKKKVLSKIKQKIAERAEIVEQYIQASKPKKQYKYVIRGKEDYRLAVLYLIDKFEELQKVYESGDMDECKDIMDIIATGLEELPKDEKLAILWKQYETWNNILYVD